MLLFLYRAKKISRASEDRSSLRSVHVHVRCEPQARTGISKERQDMGDKERQNVGG
jgi:hypothetical protein